MIPTRRLERVLSPIVAMQWLGLSPSSGNFTPKRIASISWAVLVVLPLTVLFYNSVFFISDLCNGLAILYYIGRNIFDCKDFINLLETYDKMNTPLKEVKYTFSWTLFFLAIEIMIKLGVCYLQGVVIADILLFIHCFKAMESRILVYILR
ncbi:unnamed protein product [Nezara viridula]|uniref:Uncharacterized protein n=1 Tax=Nezara viridula TaxID=85310 RepID=A0A9P0HAF3_NEZVI|nr:unnamed protein product [Nezara viridula]